MPAKTVHSLLFPPGTDVRAYLARDVNLERRTGQLPMIGTAVDDGTVDANNDVSITAANGEYLLVGVVDEIQTITTAATLGQWKATFLGQTTADLAFNISIANLKTALEALSNIAPGDVEVTGAPGAWIVKFTGAYAGQNLAQMTVANGGTPLDQPISVTTDVQGSPGTDGQLRWLRFFIGE